MELNTQRWVLTSLVLGALLPLGCSAQEANTKTSLAAPPPEAKETLATSPNKMFVTSEHLAPVFFDKGSQMDEKALAQLKANVDWLKEDLPAQIEVAGFSDNRGTPEQNLAVGQRRAAALRDYYVSMGIPRSRIVTVSYGQEQPVCFESTDECLAKNRRADTYIENKALAAR